MARKRYTIDRFPMFVVLDELTHRCLAIVVARRLRSDDVLQGLTDLLARICVLR